MTDLTDLTPGAILTLDALLVTSSGNGHDFGFMDQALTIVGFNRHKFAGFISGLSAKGCFEWTEDLSTALVERETVQFKLVDDIIARRSEIAELAELIGTVEPESELTKVDALGLTGTAGLIASMLTCLSEKHGKPCATMSEIANYLGIPVQTVRAAMLYGKHAEAFVVTGKDGRSKLWTLA